MKYILVNGFSLSKQTPKGRNDTNFERHALERLEQIIELAKRHKAKIIFTSPWLNTVTDTAAFRAVALMKTVGTPLLVNDAGIHQDAADALSLTLVNGEYQDKGIYVVAHGKGVEIHSEDQCVCMLYDALPRAISTQKEQPNAQVSLLLIGKVGRAHATKCEIETLNLCDDSVFISDSASKNTEANRNLATFESDFVKRLKASLASRKQEMDEGEEIQRLVCESIAQSGIGDQSAFNDYIQTLFDWKNQISI